MRPFFITAALFFANFLFLTSFESALAASHCKALCAARVKAEEERCLKICQSFGVEAVVKEAKALPKSRSVSAVIGQILAGLLAFSGTIFFILMLYGGGLWMAARGNENQVERAKNAIFHAVIGLIITGGSYIIVQFIFQRLVPAS